MAVREEVLMLCAEAMHAQDEGAFTQWPEYSKDDGFRDVGFVPIATDADIDNYKRMAEACLKEALSKYILSGDDELNVHQAPKLERRYE